MVPTVSGGLVLARRFGDPKRVSYGDPLWDTLDGRRVRFAGMVDASTVQVMEDDGRLLPDYRHVSQVLAY